MNGAELNHAGLLQLLCERSARLSHILKRHQTDLAASRMEDSAAQEAGLLALSSALIAADGLLERAERSLQTHLPEA